MTGESPPFSLRTWRRVLRKTGWKHPLGWLVLLSVLLTVTILVQLFPSAAGTSMPAFTPALLCVVIWSLAAAAAISLGPAGLCAVMGLLAWNAISLWGTWIGTAFLAIPVLWLLAISWAVLIRRQPRWNFPGKAAWAVLALGASWLLANPVGWGFWGFRGPASLIPALLPGVALTFLGWSGLSWGRSQEWLQPRFGILFLLSLAVLGSGLGLAFAVESAVAAGWTSEIVGSLRGWSSLAWFLTGTWFAICMAEIILFAHRRLGSSPRAWQWRVPVWALPALWFFGTLVEWWLTHPALARTLPAGFMASRLPAEWVPILSAHGWVGVVVLILCAGFLRQGKHSRTTVIRLHAIWLTSLIGLAAVGGDWLHEFPAETAVAGFPGAALVVVAAFCRALHALIPSTHDPSAPPGRHEPPSAFPFATLALALGLIAAVQGNREDWKFTAAPSVLLGMMHFPLPLILHAWWIRQKPRATRVSPGLVAGLALAGLTCSVLLLQRNPLQISPLAAGPLLWLVILVGLRWKCLHFDQSAGTVCGALLASATVAGWCRPGILLPEIPLIPRLNAPVEVLEGTMGAAQRPWMDPVYFVLLLFFTAAGAILGAIIFREREDSADPLLPLIETPPPPTLHPPPIP